MPTTTGLSRAATWGRPAWIVWVIAILVVVAAPRSAFSAATSEDADFFEREVRPILVKRCTSCHGAETQESNLRLDSRAAILLGGERGPAVAPGHPEQSRLIDVLSGDASGVSMPPDGKLANREIAALAKWIARGAPWPQSDLVRGPMEERIEIARTSHWALQPVRRIEVPSLDDPWVKGPVDAFTLPRMRQAGLEPSAVADKRVLIRRATFDLTGLPPTSRQVAAFLTDDRSDAFAKLVDRLLASPQYGHRWGRHWLDVARYADTRGYSIGREPRLPFAYTYRDYVVRAFNGDKPYDRFILEQLAADHLELTDRRDLAALGFLTVGRRYGRIHDTIDDRIDVVSRGLLALTTGCARCHDHKFDPIPTADYYSLYGVFASCEEPAELPLIETIIDSPGQTRFFSELNQRKDALESFVHTQHEELLAHLRGRVTDYLMEVVKRSEIIPSEAGISLGKDEIKPRAVQRWAKFLEDPSRVSDPVFAPWVHFASLDGANFELGAAAICERLKQLNGPPLNGLVREALTQQPPQSMVDVARSYGRLFEEVYRDAQRSDASDKAVSTDVHELRKVLLGDGSPLAIPRKDLRGYFDRETRDRQRELSRKIEEWNAKSTDAPARAMVLADKETPIQPVIFERGNPARPGDRVPRRFLQVLSRDGQVFRHGSGRLELAKAIADGRNPLTARVLVNRVWMHHFGRGLVGTPSDFGLRTAPPSHPLLLEHLAWTFVKQGWSIKQLHRHIMLSSTYQQASEPRASALSADPENRLLWRMNRRRLEFEAYRDSLLFLSGQLEPQLGGRPVEMWQPPYSRRSTIYGLVDRQHLAGVLRVFDFASPDASTPMRTMTVVPQQALFAMNSEFVAEQAKRLAECNEIRRAASAEQRIEALYEMIFSRRPTGHERTVAIRFLDAASENRPATSTQQPWEQYTQVLLMSNELMFVD